MNRQIEMLDNRIKNITLLEPKQRVHVRNIVTNKIRDFKGHIFEMDLRLAGTQRRLTYFYIHPIEFSACGLDFILEFVVD